MKACQKDRNVQTSSASHVPQDTETPTACREGGGGHLAHYSGIPPEVFTAFTQAESKGTYYELFSVPAATSTTDVNPIDRRSSAVSQVAPKRRPRRAPAIKQASSATILAFMVTSSSVLHYRIRQVGVVTNVPDVSHPGRGFRSARQLRRARQCYFCAGK
jgi:hypothetical protein